MPRKARANGGTAVIENPADAPAPAQEAPPADDQAPEGGTDGEQDGQQSRALAPSGQRIILRTAGASFTHTQAILPANASYKRAETAYWFAEGIRESSKWWHGDIINFVRENHGDKYSQLASITGVPEGSLRNVASIASKFAPERRRPAVSWSHHAAVASLPDEVADRLLIEAEGTENDDSIPEAQRHGPWSHSQIQAEAREWREANAEGSNGTAGATGTRAAKQPATGPRVFIGLQPLTKEQVDATPQDQDIYTCPATECDGLDFAENPGHCLNCGAHFADSLDACPHCADDAPSTTVTGQVITPADSVRGTVQDLLDLSGLRSLDVKAVAAEIRGNPEALSQAMGLNEWLTRLIEALAAPAPADDKPLASEPARPAPKPSSGKKSRKPAAAPAATPETAPASEDDGPVFE